MRVSDIKRPMLCVANALTLLIVPIGASDAIGSETDYAHVAALSCKTLVQSHRRGSTLGAPIADYALGKGFNGNVPNVFDTVDCECRLHEREMIGAAVAKVIEQNRLGRFPSIPVGGATADPGDLGDREAFDRWVRHEGPRPRLKWTGRYACDY